MLKSILFNSLSIASFVAFDTGGKWKLDEDGHIVMKDGDPVWLNSAGDEGTIAGNAIKRLNDEAFTARKAKEDVDKKLKKFGDLDPELARKAIETVGKLDAKTLIDAGEVDKVKAEISAQFQAQIDELKTSDNAKSEKINSMTLDGAFNSSAFVKKNIAVPVEMFRSTFGKHFKVEDGAVNAYGADGNRIMSKTQIGSPAGFEESVGILVDGYAYKDTIMKAPDANGSGNEGGGGGAGGGASISTADFDKLPPAKQAEAAALAGKGELKILD